MTEVLQRAPYKPYTFDRFLKQGAVINIIGGDYMFNDHSRNMNGANFSGASFNGNTNIQSDNNNQTQAAANDETGQLFADLIEEIKKLVPDQEEQQDNIDDLNKVKEAAVDGNKQRMVKFFSRLGKAIQVSSAGVALAKNLGIFSLLS